MNLENENNQLEEEESMDHFMKTFSKKIDKYDSLFISSFPQKINHKQMINYKAVNDSKYMEFDLGSPDMVSDLSTLTAHMRCKIQEKIGETLTNLKSGDLVGTIPGSVISNSIKNLRVFLYDTQISPEKANRYSLLSYIFEYFNKSNIMKKGINFQNGSYLDQENLRENSDVHLTCRGKEISTAFLNDGKISRGFAHSGRLFNESKSQDIIDRIHSPFLYTGLNLLLPQVSF